MWFCSDWYLYFLFRYSDQGISRVEEMSSHHISSKRMKLEKSSSFVNPFEYVHLDIFYIMFICNIVNIVQHSHLYNSFLLIIVTCIVILLVAILYRDYVGFCVIVTFSTSWNGQSSLATYGNETKLRQNWRTSGTPNLFLELWCNFVSLYWVV